MDTYLSINNKCILCCDCIDACELDGQNYLTLNIGGIDMDDNPLPPMVMGAHDYTPCHHCNGFWEDKTPCLQVCEQNAISIRRF